MIGASRENGLLPHVAPRGDTTFNRGLALPLLYRVPCKAHISWRSMRIFAAKRVLNELT